MCVELSVSTPSKISHQTSLQQDVYNKSRRLIVSPIPSSPFVHVQ